MFLITAMSYFTLGKGRLALVCQGTGREVPNRLPRDAQEVGLPEPGANKQINQSGLAWLRIRTRSGSGVLPDPSLFTLAFVFRSVVHVFNVPGGVFLEGFYSELFINNS